MRIFACSPCSASGPSPSLYTHFSPRSCNARGCVCAWVRVCVRGCVCVCTYKKEEREREREGARVRERVSTADTKMCKSRSPSPPKQLQKFSKISYKVFEDFILLIHFIPVARAHQWGFQRCGVGCCGVLLLQQSPLRLAKEVPHRRVRFFHLEREIGYMCVCV